MQLIIVIIFSFLFLVIIIFDSWWWGNAHHRFPEPNQQFKTPKYSIQLKTTNPHIRKAETRERLAFLVKNQLKDSMIIKLLVINFNY